MTFVYYLIFSATAFEMYFINNRTNLLVLIGTKTVWLFGRIDIGLRAKLFDNLTF